MKLPIPVQSPLLIAVGTVLLVLGDGAQAFSVGKNDSPAIRRDLLWKAPVGAVVAYGYGRLAYNALSVAGIQYPTAHEDRTRSILSTSLVAGIPPPAAAAVSDDRPYRVLEVGVGKSCRVLRRGLYDDALEQLAQKGIPQVQITGVDVELPTEATLREARRRVDRAAAAPRVELAVQQGDITTSLPYPDGYFDSVVCCLTLCSVPDQTPALNEIKRLIRPNGGTFAYVEHVAVTQQEAQASVFSSFLELQQRVLDPVQQAVADNCHLHRYTDEAIRSTFEIAETTQTGSVINSSAPAAKVLALERFRVESMWPVSCQCSGVIQRTTVA